MSAKIIECLIISSGARQIVEIEETSSHSLGNKEWYHGKLTRAEAVQALRDSDFDCFLIRESDSGLVLSLTYHRQVHHVAIITYGPGWYKLEGGLTHHKFTELDDLVSYYHRNAISENFQVTLGQSCRKTNTIGK